MVTPVFPSPYRSGSVADWYWVGRSVGRYHLAGAHRPYISPKITGIGIVYCCGKVLKQGSWRPYHVATVSPLLTSPSTCGEVNRDDEDKVGRAAACLRRTLNTKKNTLASM